MKVYMSRCGTCGKLMLLIGILMAVPLAVLPFYPQESNYTFAFLVPSMVSVILGLLSGLLPKKDKDCQQWNHALQNSSLTVLFAWLYGFVTGALPFVLSKQLTFVQALFEAVSGWTTTGLSVMDVTKTPQIFLFHRAFMQFCGGLGFVMVMIIFIREKQSMNLFSAEGHPDKLMPNLTKTAQTIAGMYLAFLGIGTFAYRLAGMNLFDGMVHAMCALSTGGFSTKLNSIGEYNSFSIELITIVLMLIGTTNFAVLQLLTKGKLRRAFRVSEVKFMLLLLAIFIPVTAFSLSHSLNISIGEGIRRAAFDVTSALSTTGFSTMSYTVWPPFAIGILTLLMLVGGGIGSTAGGIKLTRVYLMIRTTYINVCKRLFPARKITVSYYNKAQGKSLIDSTLIADTTGFISCYLSIFIAGSLLLTLTANCSLTEAMFEFASALGTVGLSIGITGPSTNTATLVIEMLGMIFGRLEIFIIFIGIYSGTAATRKYLQKKISAINIP
ncbi:potassium transporter TrkG [Desulfitobacterium sp. THU1]